MQTLLSILIIYDCSLMLLLLSYPFQYVAKFRYFHICCWSQIFEISSVVVLLLLSCHDVLTVSLCSSDGFWRLLQWGSYTVKHCNWTDCVCVCVCMCVCVYMMDCYTIQRKMNHGKPIVFTLRRQYEINVFISECVSAVTLSHLTCSCTIRRCRWSLFDPENVS